MSTLRALLDTNIVYDMLCKRPFDEEGILGLRVMLAFDDVELWVSAKSYTDLFYLMRKEVGTERAQDLLEETLTWSHACSVGPEDIQSALYARWADFEDCLVNVCAEKIEADFLITRDEKGFRGARIPHGSAHDFMSFVEQTTGVSYSTEALK